MEKRYGYTPHTEADIQIMLERIKAKSLEELFKDLPANIFLKNMLPIKDGKSEGEVLRELERLSEQNLSVKKAISFLGAGAYHHFIPSAVNHLIYRSEFYTSYTPYQAEVSQGTLQAIYEFQSMICHLTGMEVATASHYDGASALSEGIFMAVAETGRTEVLVSKVLNSEYKAVLSTYLGAKKINIIEIPAVNGVTDKELCEKLATEKTAAIVLQYPNFFGCIEKLSGFAEIAHKNGSLFIVSLGDPASLGLLKPPGELGADIVTGEGQSFGLPLSFGGPYVGFIASKNSFLRRLPGRIAGKTTDISGKSAFVLTLQAREQHIRRDKASSNICTNEGLCALAVTVFLSLLGPVGLQETANLCYKKAHYACKKFVSLPGVKLLFSSPFFHEFVLQFPVSVDDIKSFDGRPVFLGASLSNELPEFPNSRLICVTETITKEEIDQIATVLEHYLSSRVVTA